jgi:hypothetical protein
VLGLGLRVGLGIGPGLGLGIWLGYLCSNRGTVLGLDRVLGL